MTQPIDSEKIFDVVLAFNNAQRYEDLLNTILTKLIELTNSDAGTLYILEDDKLHFRIIKNKTLGIYQSADDKIELPPVTLNEGNIQNVSAYAALKNEIVVIDDVYESQQFNFAGPKNYDKITGYRTRSMLVLPLSTFQNNVVEVLGVIQLLNATDPHTGHSIPYGDIFSRPVLPALANIAAGTLSNLIHIQEIRKVFQSFVSAMVKAIDERSSYNSNHTLKVTALCDAFARYLSGIFPVDHPYHFTENRIEELAMAAMLHDIGKMVTPLHIMDKADRLGARLPLVRSHFAIKLAQLENDLLKNMISPDEYAARKAQLEDGLQLIETVNAAGFLPEETVEKISQLAPLTYINPNGEPAPLLESSDLEALSVRRGTLTTGEREVMQGHANTTGRILSNIAFGKYYRNVTEWASSHHEFLDGTGYPRQLKGDDLPTEVRIITIMDIFEALTADDRPYKKAMPHEKAFAILNEMAQEGKLHGELVQLFNESNIWKEVSI